MNKLKTIPILGFLVRYALLIAVTALLVLAALNDAVFVHLGSLIYLPAVGSSLLTCTLFLRHLFYRQTLDADAASGRFMDEWNAISKEQRQWQTVVITIGLLLSLALVAASVGK